MDWDLIIATLMGVITTRAYMYGKTWTEMPYRWKCPVKGCGTRIKAGSKDVVELARRTHEEGSHHAN